MGQHNSAVGLTSMNLKKYWTIVLLALFIVLPVLMNISVFILTPLLIYLVYLFGKKATLPDTFLLRYGPFITSVIFTLVVWLITASVNGGDFSGDNYGLIVFLPFSTFSLSRNSQARFGFSLSWSSFATCFSPPASPLARGGASVSRRRETKRRFPYWR
jgi:hypothetical protein